MTFMSRRWVPLAILFLALGVLLFAVSGYAMAGSFTVSNPERLEHWQRVAYGYLALICLALAGTLGALLALVRQWRRGAVNPDRAA
jgi:hypothetical protein